MPAARALPWAQAARQRAPEQAAARVRAPAAGPSQAAAQEAAQQLAPSRAAARVQGRRQPRVAGRFPAMAQAPAYWARWAAQHCRLVLHAPQAPCRPHRRRRLPRQAARQRTSSCAPAAGAVAGQSGRYSWALSKVLGQAMEGCAPAGNRWCPARWPDGCHAWAQSVGQAQGAAVAHSSGPGLGGARRGCEDAGRAGPAPTSGGTAGRISLSCQPPVAAAARDQRLGR